MENEWENFWNTGKVKDYLEYCGLGRDDRKYCAQGKDFGGEDKGADRDDTARDADGHGAFSDAVQ